jgi:hypothetical protein
MEELDSADDFFVTVFDPFGQKDIYGVEILNWVAAYQHTTFLISEYLPAEVLLFMAEYDATFWENLSDTLLGLLPAEVLEQLPEEVQARVQ